MMKLTMILTLGLGATWLAPALEDGPTHVAASSVPWDPQPQLPDTLKRVVRWKTLIGFGDDAVPQKDLSFGELELAPHAIYPGHLHPSPEMYYVLSGRISWTIGDETFVAEPGTALYTPPNTVHRMVNLGDEVARAVWAWWAPGGDASVMATGYRLTERVPSQSDAARFPDVR